MNRRRLLSLWAGGATLPLAGCLGIGDDSRADQTPSPHSWTDDCPLSQGFDVEWPDELDSPTAESFVEVYEYQYIRDVVDWEPVTQYDSLGIGVSTRGRTVERGDGYDVTVSSGWTTDTPNLDVIAVSTDPPDDVALVPHEEVPDELLWDLLDEAARADGEVVAEKIPHGERIDRYVATLDSLSTDFDPPSGSTEHGTLYVDVDGTVVELRVQPDGFHVDRELGARYYLDEHVLRRTADHDEDPLNGDLLECR